MAFSKSHLYAEEDRTTSGFFKALGHSARLRIIRKLKKEGPCTVTQLSKGHPISQPALSVHLRILRKSHLITCVEKFPYSIYMVDKKNLKRARQLCGEFFKGVY